LPGFAEIPGAGYAFGQRNNSLQDTELLILVTRADCEWRTISHGRFLRAEAMRAAAEQPAPGLFNLPRRSLSNNRVTRWFSPTLFNENDESLRDAGS